ncbi:MAG: hypothetical protein U0V74_02825 [Chitinophagales bacterium]
MRALSKTFKWLNNWFNRLSFSFQAQKLNLLNQSLLKLNLNSSSALNGIKVYIRFAEDKIQLSFPKFTSLFQWPSPFVNAPEDYLSFSFGLIESDERISDYKKHTAVICLECLSQTDIEAKSLTPCRLTEDDYLNMIMAVRKTIAVNSNGVEDVLCKNSRLILYKAALPNNGLTIVKQLFGLIKPGIKHYAHSQLLQKDNTTDLLLALKNKYIRPQISAALTPRR